MCSVFRAKVSILLVIFFSFLTCLLNLSTTTIHKEPFYDSSIHPLHNNSSNQLQATINNFSDTTTTTQHFIYSLVFKESTRTEIFLKNLNFWTQALLVRLIPCGWMIILSAILKHKMTSVQNKRRCLQRISMETRSNRGFKLNARERRTYRTTRMLIIIVFLFALTEFPNGIMNLLSGILDIEFVVEIYDKLGDPLDFLTLVNSSINFILYCAMSQQFRKTFAAIFLKSVVQEETNA